MSNIIEPVQRNLAGDFIGFTFDNIHSSELGLTRVSNGSRYESNLLPSFQDALVQPEGRDGTYYFGSTFKERPIKVQTAFDSVTEVQYRKIIETFSDKKLHKLIFDETPYKVYYAKLKQNPTIKKICFDEGEGRERIYKGELDLDFVCYTPYAYARVSHYNERVKEEEFILTFDKGESNSIMHNHILEDQNPGFELREKQFNKVYGAPICNSYNAIEWKDTSRLENLPQASDIETNETTEAVKEFSAETETSEGYERMVHRVYNPGDIPADIKFIYTPSKDEEGNYIFPHIDLILRKLNSNYEDNYFEEFKKIGIKSFTIKDEDKKKNSKILIDSKLHLISGLNEKGEKTGDVFNRYHIVGDFFEIPKCSYSDGYVIEVIGDQLNNWSMEYTYYYV